VIEAPSVIHTIAGEGLRPLAPVHLRIGRSSGADRIISWTRRNRTYQDLWLTGVDVPMSEGTELYSLRILRADTGALLRETTTTTASYTYTAAQWQADFATALAPATIRVQVAQVSALVGAGRYADAVIRFAGAGSTLRSLLHFDGSDGSTTITDAVSATTWSASGGAQLDTAQSVFGGSSLLLDGSGDKITANRTLLLPGDFAMAMRFRLAALPGGSSMTLFSQGSTGNGGRTAWFVSTSPYNLGWQIGSAGTQGATALVANRWYHAEWNRTGSSHYILLDGALELTFSNGTAMQDIQSVIGSSWAAGTDFNGWIEEFAVDGQVWHTNPFTPPISPYPDPT
jgi:hypothetical protein